jgi:Glycosyltransferase family 87
MTRDAKIATLTAIIATGFVTTVMFYYYRSFYQQAVFPGNSFLVPGLFRDFIVAWQSWRSCEFNCVGLNGSPYFPGTFLFVNVLAWIPDPGQGARTLVTLYVAFFAIYTYLSVKTNLVSASIRDTVICTLMAYPVLLEIVTANVEAILFAFLVLFVYAYKRGNFALSVVALAVCIAMKGYPAVFAVVYLADRRYRDLLALIQWVIVLSIVPLLVFHGGLQSGITGYLSRLHNNQALYSNIQVVGFAPWSHSLLNGFRLLVGPNFQAMEQLFFPYLLFALASFAAVTLYLIFVERTFWKRIAILTVTMCVLPYTSADYTLIHFFIPIYLFINHLSNESDKRFDALVIILFALLMVPKTWITLWGNPYWNINIVLDPIIMVALVAAIVVQTVGKTKVAAPISA